MIRTHLISNVVLVLTASIYLFLSVLLINVAPASAEPLLAPSSTPVIDVRVVDAYKLGHKHDPNQEERNSAGIGDIIVVKVQALKSLFDKARCLDKGEMRVENCQEQEIALYLDGRRISNIFPESIDPLQEETLQFHLQRNAENDEVWADLLGAPSLKRNFFKRATQISVGLTNSYPEPTNVRGKTFKLIRLRDNLFWVCLISLIFLLYLIYKQVTTTDLLRDYGPKPQGANERRPYSLARCQMAFWFFLVITSFLYIWLITGALDTISDSALVLLGIGAGTSLGARAIDASKPLNTPEPELSEGFLRDLLCENDEDYSFYRLQIFIWTLVLGVIFVYSVWERLSMPEFSPTLLALQGISAGTYLGFKIPES